MGFLNAPGQALVVAENVELLSLPLVPGSILTEVHDMFLGDKEPCLQPEVGEQPLVAKEVYVK